MLIATSLMYSKDNREIENQKRAIQSWAKMGFEVISCNVEEEIKILQPLFEDVEFVRLDRSGKELTGKDFPFIYDILHKIVTKVSSMDELCGIINSDILIRNVTKESLLNHFTDSHKKVLIMHRYDIDDEGDITGEYYFSGIDAFFFFPEYIKNIPDRGFMMGRPEWDHWFLREAARLGLKIYEIKNKTAFHIKHPQRWTPAESTRMSKRSFDDSYYFDTNMIMADLRNRVLLESVSENDKLLFKEEGFSKDTDKARLLEWEQGCYGECKCQSNCLFYEKEGIPHRLSILHRVPKLLEGGNISLGEIVEKPKGTPMNYIDFKDLDFFKELKDTYIYPAGRAGQLLLDCLNTYGISVKGFVDRDEALWGTHVMGTQVFDLSVLDDTYNYDHVIIATNLYVREIYDSLSKRVLKDKLILL